MTWSIVLTIITLAGLEVLLSADNAVVLAALAHKLPKHQQKKALFYGLLGAFVLRLIAILCAQWIINFWFLQVIGGGYLIWLAFKHLFTHKEHSLAETSHASPHASAGFWSTIISIELTDLAFAVDSVLAAVALSSNIWVIYTGAIIGLVAMRFAASGVLKLLEKFSALIHYAYVAVLWIGIKLTWQGCGHGFHFEIEEIPEGIFWGVMGIIVVVATIHYFYTSSRKNQIGK